MTLSTGDANENLQAQETQAKTSENMDDWVADIMDMTDGNVFSGDSDCFQG